MQVVNKNRTNVIDLQVDLAIFLFFDGTHFVCLYHFCFVSALSLLPSVTPSPKQSQSRCTVSRCVCSFSLLPNWQDVPIKSGWGVSGVWWAFPPSQGQTLRENDFKAGVCLNQSESENRVSMASVLFVEKARKRAREKAKIRAFSDENVQTPPSWFWAFPSPEGKQLQLHTAVVVNSKSENGGSKEGPFTMVWSFNSTPRNRNGLTSALVMGSTREIRHQASKKRGVIKNLLTWWCHVKSRSLCFSATIILPIFCAGFNPILRKRG